MALSIIGGILFAIFGPSIHDITGLSQTGNPDDVIKMYSLLTPFYGSYGLLAFLYYVLLESSSKQGTIGKMALGLIVTDKEGNRLTPLKAFIRNLCKIISSIICLIGYLFPLFTEKKQALHDMIAGTLVYKKDE